MPDEVSNKMEYIQKVFLAVQDHFRDEIELEELITYLDAEPLEFRSVAYESASMMLGLRDLSKGTQLNGWTKFYLRAGKEHSFHLDIGLGWAYAKSITSPDPNLNPFHPLMRWMVFDGMGYYNALFRGRRTLKNQMIPEDIDGEDRNGYDQGLGRRLWYMANGDVPKVTAFIQSFPASRYPDLWRGVGIACGYVGGNTRENLEMLINSSGEYKPQLCAGIALAAISRNASNSCTDDIETACQLLCKMPLKEIESLKTKLEANPDREAGQSFGYRIAQLDSLFAKN